MPTIRITRSFLTLNNRHLDRNFTFKVIRSSNSLITSAKVKIKRNYFLASRIEVKSGDKIYLSIQNNSEDKVLIFQGIVTNLINTNTDIQLEAEQRIIENKIFNETYKDSSLEEVLKKNIPNLKYEALTVKQEQFVLQGKKEDSVKRLLKDCCYGIDLNNCLVVHNKKVKVGKNYIIDHCCIKADVNRPVIFSIPQLELFDTVELQTQKILVKGITYDHLRQYQMILNGELYQEDPYSPPPPIQEEQIEKIPVSKPVDKATLYFENPHKLDELSEGAKNHIMNMAEQVKKEMDAEGEKFVKIYISSAYRTVESQVDILSRKIRRENGVDDMFTYYFNNIDNKSSRALHYLNGIQAYFDSINGKPVKLEEKRWNEISKSHKDEIEHMGTLSTTEGKLVDKYGGKKGEKEWKSFRTLDAERLMTEYMKPHPPDNWAFFRPSRHMIVRTDAMDISIKEERVETARKLFKKIGKGYEAGKKGEPHIHLDLR